MMKMKITLKIMNPELDLFHIKYIKQDFKMLNKKLEVHFKYKDSCFKNIHILNGILRL
jgi:hypothetical protein